MRKDSLPIAVYYEHQEWFRPLFAELDRRATPYVRLDARRHRYAAGDDRVKYSLFFNRMSSSAYTRGNGQGINYTANYLAHLEGIGTPVVNGSKSFAVETSKPLQLSLLASLGLSFPRTAVINNPDDVLAAAREIGYPVIFKPSIGGAGSGIIKYDSADALETALSTGAIDLGFHHTALLQEYVAPRGGHITRVETLDKKFLYAIQVFTTGESFNLCPADGCQVPEAADAVSGAELAGAACPVEAVKKGLRVEACIPPEEAIGAVERIARAAEIDVGGVEYIIDDRDGRILFYDINALSNFVADAQRVVGFDPHERLVDYLERRAF
jgi:glutathione synthase/RimK-type ligase-like ATP-grasp enzyme